MAINRYDKDEELNVRVDFSYFSMLKKYVAPYIGKIIAIVLVMFAIAFLELLPPYFISLVLDKCLPNKDYALLFKLGAVLVVSFAVVLVCQRIRPRIAHTMSMNIIKDVRSDLFRHMQHLPLSFFDSRPHGKILVRVVNYVNTIANLLSNGIFDMITNVFKMFVIVGFMFAMDVKFTFVCLIGLPLFVVVLFIIKTHHRKAWQKYSAKQSNLNAYIQESISGMKITQSFAREEENAEIFDGLCGESKKYWMRSVFIGGATARFVNLLSTITLTAIYAFGVGRISGGELMVGTLIGFASYVSRFWEPVIVLTNFYNEIVNCGAYIERIFQMMDEPLVIEDLPDAEPIGNIEGRVSFNNVTFAYEKGLPNILENVSFNVAKGETIALVGPTGAGKSTVINLLARFYDIQGGTITVDEKDIKHATLHSLRSQMGIMLQDSFLFSGTIADNIRYSKLDATDEEVIEASKAVCAHDFIMEFPDGYNTVVTEGGSSLSAGQKQLIAFARALLADPAILILDEATSSIDTETEIALQKGLERLLEGRTSFIIAHRLSTIKNSSRIMYIANKSIAECGTHDELLEKGGKYAELYMAQYKFLENL
ncbi:MAG: ABC transporter ATP-binding protein [Ruminococcaceae bacterium]|nr:ABC transporter ATP-binding protein [Oscillospiraceae bacterium]